MSVTLNTPDPTFPTLSHALINGYKPSIILYDGTRIFPSAITKIQDGADAVGPYVRVFYAGGRHTHQIRHPFDIATVRHQFNQLGKEVPNGSN